MRKKRSEKGSEEVRLQTTEGVEGEEGPGIRRAGKSAGEAVGGKRRIILKKEHEQMVRGERQKGCQAAEKERVKRDSRKGKDPQ